MREADPLLARLAQMERQHSAMADKVDALIREFGPLSKSIGDSGLNTSIALEYNASWLEDVDTRLNSLGTLEGSLIKDFYIDADPKTEEASVVLVTNRGKRISARLPRYRSIKSVGISEQRATDIIDVSLNGLKLKHFANKLTDGSGQFTVEITPGPQIAWAMVNDAERIAHVISIVGTTLTLTVRKLIYDKATLGSNTATGQPAGVTLQTATAGVTTSSTVATNQNTTATNQAAQSAGINPTAGIGGLAADDATHNHTQNAHTHTQDAHNHTFNELWQHTHTVTQTATSLALATTETVDILLVYVP